MHASAQQHIPLHAPDKELVRRYVMLLQPALPRVEGVGVVQVSDLRRLLEMYKIWQQKHFPLHGFDEALDQIADIGKTNQLKVSQNHHACSSHPVLCYWPACIPLSDALAAQQSQATQRLSSKVSSQSGVDMHGLTADGDAGDASGRAQGHAEKQCGGRAAAAGRGTFPCGLTAVAEDRGILCTDQSGTLHCS